MKWIKICLMVEEAEKQGEPVFLLSRENYARYSRALSERFPSIFFYHRELSPEKYEIRAPLPEERWWSDKNDPKHQK